MEKISTTCSLEYLKNGLNKLKGSTFCVGAMYGGNPLQARYSKLRLYACRLYTKCLTASEVEKNYHESVNYHKYLIGDKS